jgi:hypothetical protein
MARHSTLGLTLVAVTLATACEAPRVAPADGAVRAPALARARALVVTRALPGPPPGGDGPERFEVAWRAQALAPQAILPRPAIATADWRGGAAVIDDARTLWSLHPSRAPQRLGEDVTEIAVSDDGRALGYAVFASLEAQVRVRVGERERVLASDLAAAGTLRFTPDGRALVFVGARSGGVSGLWVAPTGDPAAEPSCLSNCELRTGRPWNGAFVPPPLRAEDLAFHGDALRYSPSSGGAFSARWRETPP